MQELLDVLPSSEAIRDFLNSPSTWLQIGVFLAGFLVVKLIAHWLLPRLQSITRPGVIEGMRRTAVRSGALALVPLLLWLWLLAAMRHPAPARLGHRPAAAGHVSWPGRWR